MSDPATGKPTAMSFTQILLDGHERAFRAHTSPPCRSSPCASWSSGSSYYGFAAIEGMLMRIYQIERSRSSRPGQYFGMLTAHPLWDLRLLLPAGVRRLPVPGSLPDEEAPVELPAGQLDAVAHRRRHHDLLARRVHLHYAPLYTLYWPLPADFDQFHPLSGPFSFLGVALIMVGRSCSSSTSSRRSPTPRPGRSASPPGRSSPRPWASPASPTCSGAASAARSTSSPCRWRPSLAARWTPPQRPGDHLHRVLILVYMVAELFGTSLKDTRGRCPSLQELVLVGPGPNRRRDGADLRGRHLVPAGDADHRQAAVHARTSPGPPCWWSWWCPGRCGRTTCSPTRPSLRSSRSSPGRR